MSDKENILLAKWLAGEISVDELKTLQKHVNLSKLERVLKRQDTFELEVKPNDDMWEDFQQGLEVSSTQNRSLQNANVPHGISNKTTRSLFLKLGALFLLLSAIGGLIWHFMPNRSIQKIETPTTKTETIQYADGTQIHISPLSTVTYDNSKWDNRRDVILEGQAYFEVVKGSKFQVLTLQGKVEVLGTKFDIWEMDSIMRVQCFEGKVKVSGGNKSITISKNEQVFVRGNKLGNVEEIVTSQPDWMQNQRYYQKIPLQSVLKDIERFYGVKTNASAVKITDHFGGVIPTDDLKKALDYLTKSVNWTYENKESTIYFYPE